MELQALCILHMSAVLLMGMQKVMRMVRALPMGLAGAESSMQLQIINQLTKTSTHQSSDHQLLGFRV